MYDIPLEQAVSTSTSFNFLSFRFMLALDLDGLYAFCNKMTNLAYMGFKHMQRNQFSEFRSFSQI